jgi:glycine/D-amino acid oxidase-like deaminating enzyme
MAHAPAPDPQLGPPREAVVPAAGAEAGGATTMPLGSAPDMPGRSAGGVVLWLEQAMAAEAEAGVPSVAPPLAGRVGAAVCVVGGGFTGLWTAIEIKERHPDADVVLLEAASCGFGASGRNGGWATGWHDELDHLIELWGLDDALLLAEESSRAIAHIGETCDRYGIDGGFRQHGALWVASTPAQLGASSGALDACRAHGRSGLLEEVSEVEVRQHTGAAGLLGGARHTDAAAVHPGRLVRGLRQVAVRLGVRLHEGTPVLAVEDSAPAVVHTLAGRVEADAVVLALGAWSGLLEELRRAFVVVGSHIVATEPLGSRLDPWPWAEGELLGDSQTSVHYAQVSPDRRIVFGRGLGTIGWRSSPSARQFFDPKVTRAVEGDFRRWFPSLADARFTHAWGGAVDRSPTHLPFVGTWGDAGNVHYGAGFSGNGVAPSVVVAKTLASLATQSPDRLTRSALATGPRALLPPEPLRSLGGTVVRRAVVHADDTEAAGGTPSLASRSLRHLVHFSLPSTGPLAGGSLTGLRRRLARRNATAAGPDGQHAR